MDGSRFDHLARSLGRRASRRGVLGVLVGALALLRSTGLVQADPAKTGRKAGAKQRGRAKGEDASEQQIAVCHKGKTLAVAPSAVQAHLNHGDSLGPCGSSISQPPPPTGGCTPLLQICWPEWLGGNPCCDANAECLYVNADVPAFFCLDSSKTGCTSDAECKARFTDPNIACLHRFPATCRSGVTQCCQRKTCPTGLECGEGVVCCNSAASLLQNVCCAANQTQICNPAGGCVTP